MACQGQFRVAPSGHVLGLEMGVALKMAEARGYDLVVVSELLAAAEIGMLEAMRTDDQTS